jgi:hypothetical protein
MEYVIRKTQCSNRHELSECDNGHVRVVAAGSPLAVLAAAKLFGGVVKFRDIYSYLDAAQATQAEETP